MRLYIDTASGNLINEPSYKLPVGTLTFKRGDHTTINLSFVSGTSLTAATTARQIIFGLKESGKYDGSFIVSTSAFTVYNTNQYVFNPSLNTTSLNALLCALDGDDTNDVATITLMGEFTWSDDSGSTWYTTNTFDAVIDNDVIKNVEGSPTTQPTPEDWLNTYSNGTSISSTNFAVKNADNHFTANQTIHGNLSASGILRVGLNAGLGGATDADTVFIGTNAGTIASSVEHVNFLGNKAGYGATSASYSNFMGYQAGDNATDATHSNFMGRQAGYNAYSANNSNFIGQCAGNHACCAKHSNFLGCEAGRNAQNACYSNFIGFTAGKYATAAYDSNFIGDYAGLCACDAKFSNFIGTGAGYNACYASYAQFIGRFAGCGANIAGSAVFIGDSAGQLAAYSGNSIFLGFNAGASATCACNSQFIGGNAGASAIYASYSTFIGDAAGLNAISASNSIAIGAGAMPTGPNQLVFGSAAHPLSTIPGGAGTLSDAVSGLRIMVNDRMFTLPLLG